jgi:2-polyprenyl-6-methoxyphenol hydroxylase-like FAD-dependent oxidoreductase
MTRTEHRNSEVVIVGGGPVGMGLAIDLGRRGVSCVVIERYADPQPIPKGQNLTQRTLEHFYFWGIEQDLRAARTIPKDFGIGGLTAYGTLLSHYTYDWMQRELVRPYYFTDNERLPQYATEAVLRRRAAALPAIRTLYGWIAEEIRQDGDGVDVVVADRATGERRTIRGTFAVGCDGSRSLVREQAHITQTRSDHDRKMVLLVFRSRELHGLLERYPGKSYYSVLHPDLDGYWKFFGRVDLGTTWFFHAPVPAGTTNDNFNFREYLHAAVGAEFDVEIDHIGFWDLRIASADRYRNGRIFIAGDAAHSHPPYGGYGINTGLEDAVNLSWKLTAALEGWAGPSLLDTYDEERRPVFRSTARDFIERAIEADRRFLRGFSPDRDKAAFEAEWNARRSGARSEVNAFEPNYAGSSVVWGEASAGCSASGSHAFKARPGHHLAPQPLSTGRNVFEELGPGFTLLSFGRDEVAAEAFLQSAAAQRVPLKVVRDTWTGGRERYEAGLVLVRPDQFVAWAGDQPDPSPSEIMKRSLGAGDGLQSLS